MSDLARQACQPCRRGAAPLAAEEIDRYAAQVPGWRVLEVGGIKRLERAFPCVDFAAALEFTNRIGAIAEESDHHPAILLEWGRVTVQWWTHTAGGLHMNDFIMAARTEALLPLRGVSAL